MLRWASKVLYENLPSGVGGAELPDHELHVRRLGVFRPEIEGEPFVVTRAWLPIGAWATLGLVTMRAVHQRGHHEGQSPETGVPEIGQIGQPTEGHWIEILSSNPFLEPD